MGLFIEPLEKRQSLVKDFLKSKRSERNWSRHRTQMLWGIRRFHHSLEGRKLHRQLGRYLATRPQYGKEGLFRLRDENVGKR